MNLQIGEFFVDNSNAVETKIKMRQRFEFVDDGRNLDELVVSEIKKRQTALQRSHRLGKSRQIVLLQR